MTDAARDGAALEEGPRPRVEEIRSTEAATARVAAVDTGPSTAPEIARVHRFGHQRDHPDTAALQRPSSAAASAARRS